MTQQPQQSANAGLNLRGAVDLSGLGSPARPTPTSAGTPASPTPPAGAPVHSDGGGESASPVVPSLVVDVTEATFASIVQLSTQVPVILDLWAEWCEPCRQLTPALVEVVESHNGALVLGKVNVDENPSISAAFKVQSIPSVFALIGGQPVPLFQGALPKGQIAKVAEELLKVAQQNGVNGTVTLDTNAEMTAPEPTLPPLHAKAYEALEAGDLTSAADAYKQAIVENPGDSMAAAGLAQVDLLQRTQTCDPNEVRANAANNPSDIDAQFAAADLDLVGGHVEDSFARLIELVRTTSGDERDKVRERLVELFTVVGDDDPRVGTARRALASALF